MKLRKFSTKELLTNKNLYKIIYNDWFMYNAGYRVINAIGEICGYIDFRQFLKLLNGNYICREAQTCGTIYYDFI